MRPTAALTSRKSADGSVKYQSPNQNIPPGSDTYTKKSTSNHGGTSKPAKVS
jgi:hypothetical protein